MTNMIEKAARAMYDAHAASGARDWAFVANGEQWRLFEPHARAVFLAIRVPDDAMMKAGGRLILDNDSGYGEQTAAEHAADIYTAAIDSILKEGT